MIQNVQRYRLKKQTMWSLKEIKVDELEGRRAIDEMDGFEVVRTYPVIPNKAGAVMAIVSDYVRDGTDLLEIDKRVKPHLAHLEDQI